MKDRSSKQKELRHSHEGTAGDIVVVRNGHRCRTEAAGSNERCCGKCLFVSGRDMHLFDIGT